MLFLSSIIMKFFFVSVGGSLIDKYIYDFVIVSFHFIDHLSGSTRQLPNWPTNETCNAYMKHCQQYIDIICFIFFVPFSFISFVGFGFYILNKYSVACKPHYVNCINVTLLFINIMASSSAPNEQENWKKKQTKNKKEKRKWKIALHVFHLVFLTWINFDCIGRDMPTV